MAKYGIVIDLNKCIRCRTCMVACKIQNNIPPKARGRAEHYRMRPVEWEEGVYPQVRRIFIPILCMHCEKPACLESCPADAISKRSDGLVVIDKDKCVACGTCNESCPYGVPFLMEKADKCDFCSSARLDRGEKEPYCVKSCVGEAMSFGDLDDPGSEICKLIASGKAMALCPEFGTGPHVFYIPPAWYREQWPALADNRRFMEALEARKKDLAKPKETSIPFLEKSLQASALFRSPLGAIAIGAIGLDYLGRRKARVASEEEDKVS